MKKFLNQAIYFSILIVLLGVASCQKEHDVRPEEEGNEETITASSATAMLIEQTCTQDGSFDNIVDGASCLAIQFPYTVEVNGLEVTVDSREDLKVIEEIFDALEDDIDVLEIFFPITITLGDFTEVVIQNKQELGELAQECIEGGGDDDIECVDFIYPITLYSFDINLQSTGEITVESDKQLRRFFAGLGETDIVGFDFPIQLEMYDGTEINVNTNTELVAALERAKNACDEDDDDDYNDDDFTLDRLEELLVTCPWKVNEILRDNINHTDQYYDYFMVFSEDGSVLMKTLLGGVVVGTWNTGIKENKVTLTLDFDLLLDFTLEWYVYEIEEGKIKLHSGDGNRVIMDSSCNAFDGVADNLRNILKECTWVIEKLQYQDEDLDRLIGYVFTFHAEGVLTLSGNGETLNGTWEVVTQIGGRTLMKCNIADEPGVTFEWPLVDMKDDRLKFEASELGYEMLLQRVCPDTNTDGDLLEIRNILMGGSWVVSQCVKDGVDKTADFIGYDFDFGIEGVAEISLDMLPTTVGLWNVLRDSENKLKCLLNYGLFEPFSMLNENWEIVSVTEARIELKHIGAEGSIDILVFEK